MRNNNLTKENAETTLHFRYDIENMIQVTAEICTRLNGIYDLDELLEQSILLSYKQLGYAQVTLHLLDSDLQRFAVQIQADITQPQVSHNFVPKEFSKLAYLAAKESRVIKINNLEVEAPRFFKANTLGIRSELHFPLEQDNRVIGVFSLGCIQQNAFVQADLVTVLKTLATQIAVSVDRVYHHNQDEELSSYSASVPVSLEGDYVHVVDLHHLLPNIQSLSGGLRQVYDRIVVGVVQGLGYKGAILAVVNEADKRLTIQAIAYSNFMHHQNWDIVEQLVDVKILGNSVSLIDDQNNIGVQACITGQAKQSHNLNDFFQPIVNSDLTHRIQQSTDIQTCIAIPLLVGNKTVGCLFVGSERNQISLADLESLRFFVTNAAIAVQNSLLFEQVNQELIRRETELEQLRKVEQVINSSLDLDEVLKHILTSAVELTNAEYGQVVLTGKYATGLVNRVSYPESLDLSYLEQFGITNLLANQSPPRLSVIDRLLHKDSTHINGSDGYQTTNPRAKSVLGMPISLENELIGVINIASQQEGVFQEQSLEMLKQIAVQAALAIKNAYQFKSEHNIQERLANVAQVVAMGDMASNMVHSINNWVGAIRADLKYVLRQQEEAKDANLEHFEIFNDMLSNAELTLAMAENIRKPFQPSTQEPIDVNACIHNVLTQKRKKLKNTIVIEDLKEVPPVMATAQLELVFENLINNALQAMQDQVRGILKFSTRYSENEQRVLITIQDTGEGLPDHLNPEDIFKLGVSSRKDGLGYGLWWSDTFLKRWGGQIEYVKNTKRGCKFLITVPAVIDTRST